MATEKRKTKAAKLARGLTPQERTALGSFVARQATTVAPRLKVDENRISTDHADMVIGHGLLMDAFGTADPDFLDGFLAQLANVNSRGQDIDERKLNFVASLVKAVKPRDEIESMLAAQMA